VTLPDTKESHTALTHHYTINVHKVKRGAEAQTVCVQVECLQVNTSICGYGATSHTQHMHIA